MDLSLAAKNVGRTISDNSPVILTGMAVAGSLGSVVLAAKAGMRAQRELDDLLEEIEAGRADEDLLTFQGKLKTTWKFYIPAGLMTGATVACVIGANSVNTRRNAAIMSAYSLTDKAFQEYKEKVAEKIGEKKEQEVRDDISKDRLEANPPKENSVVVVGDGKQLCYDGMTGRYFQSDMQTIRKAVNDINQQCINEVYASQNDFYRLLDLDPVAIGEEVGWRSDHMLDVSYSSHITGEGVTCLAIDYLVGPIRGYYNGH